MDARRTAKVAETFGNGAGMLKVPSLTGGAPVSANACNFLLRPAQQQGDAVAGCPDTTTSAVKISGDRPASTTPNQVRPGRALTNPLAIVRSRASCRASTALSDTMPSGVLSATPPASLCTTAGARRVHELLIAVKRSRRRRARASFDRPFRSRDYQGILATLTNQKGSGPNFPDSPAEAGRPGQDSRRGGRWASRCRPHAGRHRGPALPLARRLPAGTVLASLLSPCRRSRARSLGPRCRVCRDSGSSSECCSS